MDKNLRTLALLYKKEKLHSDIVKTEVRTWPLFPIKKLFPNSPTERLHSRNSTDGWTDGWVIWNKSERERQILYNLTYMWNLKDTITYSKYYKSRAYSSSWLVFSLLERKSGNIFWSGEAQFGQFCNFGFNTKELSRHLLSGPPKTERYQACWSWSYRWAENTWVCPDSYPWVQCPLSYSYSLFCIHSIISPTLNNWAYLITFGICLLWRFYCHIIVLTGLFMP